MDAKKQVIEIIKTVYELIKATGTEGIPSGHLYARLMPLGCEMRHYEMIIGTLVNAGLVTETNHLLRAK